MRISDRDTTPVSRPDTWAPGKDAAGTDEKPWPGSGDACGPEPVPADGMRMVEVLGEISDPGVKPVTGVDPRLVFECGRLGVRSGVAGALGEGDADSTTHIR